MYNLLKHLVEEFTLKNNFSKHHNILFNMVLDQETVLELSLFASDDKITGFSWRVFHRVLLLFLDS